MGPQIIALLWLVIYVVLLCGVVYLIFYALEHVAEFKIDAKIKKGVWFIVFVLILIWLVATLLGVAPTGRMLR